MTREEITRLSDHLKGATSFPALFGACTTDAELAAAYRRLALAIHPDTQPEELRPLAGPVFALLGQLRKMAGEALAAGTYSRPFTSTATQKIRSARGVYTVLPAAPERGSHSRVYRAEDEKGQPVLLKIAAKPTDNALLEAEVALLEKTRDVVRFPTLGRFVPMVLDSFWLPGAPGTRYRVTVMPYDKRFLSVRQVGPLDPRDAAWICRRVVGQVIAAQSLGVVHGAITPENILVDPITHDPLHIGWTQSTPAEGRSRSAPEGSDIHQAGKTMIYVMGGNLTTNTLPATVDLRVAEVIARCVSPRRLKDGPQLLSDLTKAIRAAWGSVYRPLNVTVPN